VDRFIDEVCAGVAASEPVQEWAGVATRVQFEAFAHAQLQQPVKDGVGSAGTWQPIQLDDRAFGERVPLVWLAAEARHARGGVGEHLLLGVEV
jgi:hypothetical protein